MAFVSIIIPARNEADKIGLTIQALMQSKPTEVTEVEIIVVDDASEDETSEVAKRAGATKVVKLQKHSGKGAALKSGVKEAKGEVILFADADLGETAKGIWQVVIPVIKGEVDMAIAAPPPDPKGGGFSVVKTFASWAIRATTGFNPKAPLSGQRAIKRKVLESVYLADGYAVETALTIDAVREGFKVTEVPVTFGHRALGRSFKGFLHRAKQLWDIFWAILPRLLMRKGFRHK